MTRLGRNMVQTNFSYINNVSCVQRSFLYYYYYHYYYYYYYHNYMNPVKNCYFYCQHQPVYRHSVDTVSLC